MAPADAVSIVRELGVCKSGESRAVALLGAANHAAPYSPRCAKTRNHQTNRLAYFSSHLFDAASIYRRRAEDHARAAAPLDNSRDARYVHAGSDTRKAQSARARCRPSV